jgi:hypothetical protein
MVKWGVICPKLHILKHHDKQYALYERTQLHAALLILQLPAGIKLVTKIEDEKLVPYVFSDAS